MDAAARTALLRQLDQRRDAIAAGWHRAIARTGFAQVAPAAVERALARLVDEAAELLAADDLDRTRAREIGIKLVALGYGTPATLGETVETLGCELGADLPPAQFVALQPRLMALLAALAGGFCAAQRDAILAEQEAQRRRQLAERRRVEERLRVVLGHAPLILFALDRHGTIKLSEGQGLTALRRPDETTVGRSVFEVYRETPEVLDYAGRALAGEAFTAVIRLRNATFETHFIPLRDDTGALVGTMGVGLNITARAEAEAARRRYEAHLSATEQKLLPLLARADLTTYRQVGAPLGLDPERVRDLVKSIAGKLGVEAHRVDVVAAIRARGLL